jgi:hypothetical protein
VVKDEGSPQTLFVQCMSQQLSQQLMWWTVPAPSNEVP